MEKNWVGNSNSIFKTLGASNQTKENRERWDYYATDPIAAKMLLDLEDFNDILEPSCGEGHLSKVFIENGKNVTSSDLIDRGFGEVKDFFTYTFWDGDIITNPPYKYALEFVQHSLKIIPKGRKVAMFLKLQFLEGKKRGVFFDFNPPKKVYVAKKRILCAKNGDFAGMKMGGGGAIAYGWFIWEKGWNGDTILKWFH